MSLLKFNQNILTSFSPPFSSEAYFAFSFFFFFFIPHFSSTARYYGRWVLREEGRKISSKTVSKENVMPILNKSIVRTRRQHVSAKNIHPPTAVLTSYSYVVLLNPTYLEAATTNRKAPQLGFYELCWHNFEHNEC